MRQKLTQTLLPHKVKKLKFILDWAEEHCDKEQKRRLAEVIEQYDYMLTFPPHEQMRVTHAVDYLSHVPTVQEVENTEKHKQKLRKQIKKRRKAANGLITEIEELKQVLHEVLNEEKRNE